MHVRRHAHERGANLVEAAVVIPLLLMILVGVVDLGRAYFTYITVIDAAREGARYGASHPADADRDAQICAMVLAEAQGQPLPVSLSCANATINTTGAPGTPVRVTVTVDFPVIMGGLLGRSTFPISYSVAFRIRCEVGSTC